MGWTPSRRVQQPIMDVVLRAGKGGAHHTRKHGREARRLHRPTSLINAQKRGPGARQSRATLVTVTVTRRHVTVTR